MGAIIGVVAALILIGIGVAIYHDNDQINRRDAAFRYAQRACKGQAETYDVQDQAKIVYACRADGRLRVLDYGEWTP